MRSPLEPRLTITITTRGLATAGQLTQLRAAPGGASRLLGVADISCDIGGAVEALVDSTSIEAPYFVVDPASGDHAAGLDAFPENGLFMMGVDILPSELPREASQHFGSALMPYVADLAESSGEGAIELPAELRGATIAADGRLRSRYKYISQMRAMRDSIDAKAAEGGDLAALDVAGSTVLRLDGHLFDSGLINEALDVVEAAGGGFSLLQCDVVPPVAGGTSDRGSGPQTSALLQASERAYAVVCVYICVFSFPSRAAARPVVVRVSLRYERAAGGRRKRKRAPRVAPELGAGRRAA